MGAGDGGTDAEGGVALKEPGGADISGLKKGLRRSMETVQGLPFLIKTKVFSDLFSTSCGPTYGGVNGFLTASTLTKTAGQEERATGTAAGTECRPAWNSTGKGAESRIESRN